MSAGEPIVTIIDLTDVYLTVFLPAADRAKLGTGDEARVILDAAPDYVIPAAVSFIASETRISPKAVETKEERAKQTFRVDLRIDPQVMKTYHGRVAAGLPGAGFVRTKRDVKWPAELEIKLPPAPVAQEPSPAPARAQEQKPGAVAPSSRPGARASLTPAPVTGAPASSHVAQETKPVSTPAPVSEKPKPEAVPTPKAGEPRSASAPAAVAETPKRAPAPSAVDPQASTPAPTAEAQPPAPAPVAEASTTSASAQEEPMVEFAPERLTQLVGAWASSAQDCNRLFQRKGRAIKYRQPIDQFAQAAIVEPQRICTPTATCQLDSAVSDGGSLKVIAECADIVSYTSRTVYVKLRSNDELVYSPTGDPVLATNLRKCPL